jgi:hypothetical protein
MVALLVYGAGTATNLQARYVGADLAPVDRRGASISSILVATTVGAVAGPNLVEPTGRLATAIGLPALAGPFLLATVAYAAAGLVLLARLRPDPLLTARALAHTPGPATRASGAATAADADGRLDTAALRLGAAAMILTQVVMVAGMTMTPIHMSDNHHSMAATGLVIAVHIAAMYLPSPLTGRLADRYGARAALAAGGLALLAAGVLAAAAPTSRSGSWPWHWRCSASAGTSACSAAPPWSPPPSPWHSGAASRGGVDLAVDLAVALAGATGGMASGMVTR